MNPYSDAQLESLLSGGESALAERKRSAADRSGLRRNICAFANDLAGAGKPGVIFVGVENDGSCAGIRIDDALLRTLAQMRGDGNILPLPTMTVEKKILAGCEIAVVQVEPAENPPVRYEGRVWVKVGPTTQQASAEEERRLSERQQARNLSFDMRPVAGASLDDLDDDYVRTQYLPCAVAEDVLERNTRPLRRQLQSLRLTAGDVPTWGALLGMARDSQAWRPGAYVQFLRMDGRELTDPIRNRKELTGKLGDILRRLDELLALNVSVRPEFVSVPRERRYPDYPVDALRQLAWNAIMHRQYDGTNDPVRVYWYSDRVEIGNPGGLYGRVNRKNFGEGVVDYRNPLVAEIMRNLGFAQRFGMGVPLARDSLAKNGNPPPEFEFDPVRVLVKVRAAK